MSKHRIERINSLLTEVLSEVIQREVKDPRLPSLITVTKVEVSNDLRFAKVYISVIGSNEDKALALEVLEDAAGYIGIAASKKVVLRYFPSLSFKLDTSIEKHSRIDALLHQIEEEKSSRNASPSASDDT